MNDDQESTTGFLHLCNESGCPLPWLARNLEPQVYARPPRNRNALGYGLPILLGGIVIVFLSRDAAQPMDPWNLTQTAHQLTGVIFSILGLGILRRARFSGKSSLVLDRDGLWPEDLRKEEALVPFKAIAASKDHSLLHRLSLLDKSGETLLELDYDLENYTYWRGEIARGMSVCRGPSSWPVVVSTPWTHRLAMFLLPLGCLLLGYFLLNRGPFGTLLSLLLFASALLVVHHLITAPLRLEVGRDTMRLDFLMKSQSFRRADLDTQFVLVGHQGLYRPSHVHIHLWSGKELNLAFASMPATELDRLLKDWRSLPEGAPVT